MLKKRLIPQLLIDKKKLLKTYKYSHPRYLGDPLNAVTIFNEKKADEIIIIDINNDKEIPYPDYNYISKLASECFMPFGYGGKINSLDTAKKIFDLGVEKVVIQSAAFNDPKIISDIAKIYGSQSVVVSLDFKKNIFSNYNLFCKKLKLKNKYEFTIYLNNFINAGAGEILVNSVDLEGTFKGLDLNLLKKIKKLCNVPVLINGGLKNINNANDAFVVGADGVVGGSFFVYYGKHNAILITYPNENELFF